MPPKATQTLKKHISGGKFSDHQIGVKVYTLFNHLGGNEYGTAPGIAVFPEPFHPFSLKLLTPPEGEAGMEQTNNDLGR
ncbi:MAG: hypothetical protein DDT34_02038 [Firmicutes bacterium]|nr:hypothetical protein [Bacillota bacterium]